MRKNIIAALSVIALSVALPATAQIQTSPDRRDSETQARDQDRSSASQVDLTAADRRLNEIYQRRVVEARVADRTTGRDGHHARSRDWYSQEGALRTAERNWIAYRDADCRYLAQPDVGHAQFAGSRRSCLLDRTNERITILREARMNLSAR
jgi:uncharacterized protein YecT (DUF1311 family)